MKILGKNDQNLSDHFNKQISLFQEYSIQQTQVLSNLSINQLRLNKAISYLINTTNTDKERSIYYAHISQILIILSDNLQDLYEEINRLTNIIAFSYSSSMHHSILSTHDIKIMISKLKSIYDANSNQILDLDYRYYYNIIKLGSYYINKKIVIVLKFPIMSSSTYDLYKLCPVPNKDDNIILPLLPYLATNSQEFAYIAAECPKVDSIFICELDIKQRTRNQRDCIHRLIYLQEIDESCSPTPISLTKEALTELDNQHYIITFPNSTKVLLSCDQDRYEILQGSFLAMIPHTCKISTPEFTIVNRDDKVLGKVVEIMTFPHSFSTPTNKLSHRYKLNSIELRNLHNIQHQITMEVPVKVNEIDSLSIYHTTIPLYAILILSATVPIILYFYRRRNSLKITSNKDDKNKPKQDSLSSSLAERKAATFSLDIGK